MQELEGLKITMDILLLAPLLVAPYMIIPVLYIILKNQYDVYTIVRISGMLALLIFVAFIQFPYYFCGYSEVKSYSVGEGLGIHKYGLINEYAYMYSNKFLGTYWIITSQIFILVKEDVKHYGIFPFVKLIVVIYCGITIMEMYHYEVISNYLD